MRTKVLVVVVGMLIGVVGALHTSATASHSPSHPCDVVASTAGVNANPGTAEQPVRTAQRLVNLLQPGQTGCLRGTAAAKPFQENVTVSDKNVGGSEAGRITIRSYPGEIAKLRGRLFVAATANYITFSHLVLDGRWYPTPNGTYSPRIDGHEIFFLDNNITGLDTGRCFKMGVLGAATANRVVLQRNRIHNCNGAVWAENSVYVSLYQNLVYDNSNYAVALTPNAQVSSLQNNVFDGNGGGMLLGGNASTASSTNYFSYNIASNPTTDWNVGYSWGMPPAPVGTFNLVQQSCLYAANHPDPGKRDHGGIQWPPVGFAATGTLVYDDPQYVDRGAKDFHLRPGSPCLGLSGDVAAAVEAGGAPTDEQASADNQQPNVLFIVTDDQRADGTLNDVVMPKTIERLKNGGTEFTNGFSTTPLCCPARSSIFSGRYVHNHGVTNNGFTQRFDQDKSLQAYLRSEAQYRTGIFGKFLNFWDLDEDPEHWDDFSVTGRSQDCPFLVREWQQSEGRGEKKRYPPLTPTGFAQPGECKPGPAPTGNIGRDPDLGPYFTDYLGQKAAEFIDDSESDDSKPWFLYLATSAPHGPYDGPAVEADYADADVGPNPHTPAHTEGEPGDPNPITDKPKWIQDMFETAPEGVKPRQQKRMLRSVDDTVELVMSRLEARGEQDTLVVFISDNGFMWGEHGLTDKLLPYTESIRVPYLMRYAPYTRPAAEDARLVTNIDLVPTVLDAAGLTRAREPQLDGLSLLDLLRDSTKQRNRILTEGYNHADHPADDSVTTPPPPYYDALRNWASTRTATYQYTESYDEDGVTVKGREYYDLVSDPLQLDNLFDDGIEGNEPPIQPLHDQLLRDRLCEGTQCPAAPDQGQGPTTDTRTPWAYLAAPRPNDYVCCRARLLASTTDNFGVTGLRFQVDGTPIGTELTGLPWQEIWDTGSAAQSSQVTQHTIEARARDSEGNVGTSDPVTVNVDRGLDVQIDDPDGPDYDPERGGFFQFPNTGDVITYAFGRPLDAGMFISGWDGTRPDCSLSPIPPGCVTVTLSGDGRLDEGDFDTLAIHQDEAATQPLPAFGSVDLGVDNYMAMAPIRQRFVRSTAELSADRTTIRISLGIGAVPARQAGAGTMHWLLTDDARDSLGLPICGTCRVWESYDGTETAADREF